MKLFRRIYLIALVASLACSQAPAADAPPTTAAASRPTPAIKAVQVIHDTNYTRADHERLIVTLNIVPGPDMKLAYIQRIVRADKATDNKGNSLVFTAPIPDDLRPSDTSPGRTADELVKVILQPPGPDVELGKTIQSIEGAIPAALITKTDTIDLPTPGSAKREYANGVKAEFTLTMTSPTVCNVHYSFDLPKELSDAERTMWLSQEISIKTKVIDSQKQQWRQGGGGGSTTQGPNHFSLTQSYTIPFGGAAGTPPGVSYEVISQTRLITIPFHVENIPLP